MKDYRFVLMDLDGTLFDFKASEQESFFRTFHEHGIAVSKEVYHRYHVINQEMWGLLERGEIDLPFLKVERFKLAMEEFGITADPAAINRSYLRYLSNSVVLFEGAMEFCRRLSGKYRICAVTNGMKDNQYNRLSLSGLSPYIGTMITSEEAGAPKPEARIFEEALLLCGSPRKDECVLIGDSVAADVKGALSFGIDVIWFNPTEKPIADESPQFTARTYEEILLYLQV